MCLLEIFLHLLRLSRSDDLVALSFQVAIRPQRIPPAAASDVPPLYLEINFMSGHSIGVLWWRSEPVPLTVSLN